ncbi:MAG: DUF1549 domain-containing protein [Pirellulaceae bacterium]|nr:DUF1549 domain-containing protein [Pirellulaceae bacterium]
MQTTASVRLFLLSALLIAAPAIASGQNRPNKPGKRPQPKSKLPQTQRQSGPPVAKVDPATLDRVKRGAAKIDELVAANYRIHGITPNPLTTDEQFVRRIYLDITGTVPNYRQAKTFIEAKDSSKRSRLIDRLLSSSGYASHTYNWFANILRLTDRPDPNIYAKPYNEWVKQAIRDNMAFDKMVRAMLTAEGKVWDNPPAGFWLRDAGMPLDSINNTVRVFLGTRIGCAQCHDHPFDRWTQREFYELAAFSYGVKTRLDRRDGIFKNGNPITRVRAELKRQDPTHKGNGPFVRLLRSNMYAVTDDTRRKLKLPHDYQYDNGKPGDLVEPSVLFADAALTEGASPRETLANWMTSKENPRFAKTIANRLWKRSFGVGVIEPADDMRDETEAENEQLMEYLIAIMRYLDFDLKEFQRVIYNTRTYQRQASTQQVAATDVYHFPGPLLRRMTAEQAWDTLLTLAVYSPDSIQLPSTKNVKAIIDVGDRRRSGRQGGSVRGEFRPQGAEQVAARARLQGSVAGAGVRTAVSLAAGPLPPAIRPGGSRVDFRLDGRRLRAPDSHNVQRTSHAHDAGKRVGDLRRGGEGEDDERSRRRDLSQHPRPQADQRRSPTGDSRNPRRQQRRLRQRDLGVDQHSRVPIRAIVPICEKTPAPRGDTWRQPWLPFQTTIPLGPPRIAAPS